MLTLMPLAGPSAVQGYLSRIEAALKDQLEPFDFTTAASAACQRGQWPGTCWCGT